MRLGVLADPADTCARELAARIAEFSGERCPIFDLSVPASDRVEVSRSGIVWAGVDLGALDKLVVAGFDFQDPLVPRAVPSVDWSVWQIDYIVDQQRSSFLASVLRDQERRGIRVINSWHALRLGFAKARLFGELQRAGLRVPAWLCSNDMPVVERFCAQHRYVMWRPGTGRAIWQLFLDKQREHCVDPGKPPVLLAVHPEQGFVRAFVCNGEVLFALICTAPYVDGTDERMEQLSACDSDAVAHELVRAVNQIRADWAQVTYVVQDGRACIYDIDVDPRYGWMPAEFRNYLQVRLARKLLELPPVPAAELPVPAPRVRDSLFVRRMLVPLHQMEATKYAQDKPLA